MQPFHSFTVRLASRKGISSHFLRFVGVPSENHDVPASWSYAWIFDVGIELDRDMIEFGRDGLSLSVLLENSANTPPVRSDIVFGVIGRGVNVPMKTLGDFPPIKPVDPSDFVMDPVTDGGYEHAPEEHEEELPIQCDVAEDRDAYEHTDREGGDRKDDQADDDSSPPVVEMEDDEALSRALLGYLFRSDKFHNLTRYHYRCLTVEAGRLIFPEAVAVMHYSVGNKRWYIEDFGEVLLTDEYLFVILEDPTPSLARVKNPFRGKDAPDIDDELLANSLKKCIRLVFQELKDTNVVYHIDRRYKKRDRKAKPGPDGEPPKRKSTAKNEECQIAESTKSTARKFKRHLENIATRLKPGELKSWIKNSIDYPSLMEPTYHFRPHTWRMVLGSRLRDSLTVFIHNNRVQWGGYTRDLAPFLAMGFDLWASILAYLDPIENPEETHFPHLVENAVPVDEAYETVDGEQTENPVVDVE